jgi:PST family polysaccharide transporter
LAPLGALPACAAVGVAFGGHALVGLLYLHRFEGIPAARMLAELARPLFACVPMVAAVLAVRSAVAYFGLGGSLLGLGAEVLAGAAVFALSARWLAPAASRELVRLLREALRRRSAPVAPAQGAPDLG